MNQKTASATTVTVPIGEPFDHDGKTYSQLTFRKMKVKDMIKADAVTGEFRKSCAMYASMADVPIQVIENLDTDNFTEIALKVAPLMGKSGKKAVAEAIAGLQDGADDPASA
ncbi:phage tail assembly protein [Jiella endophytica]|uniref:Phage tail assembly protein n=1 Tax=Jiella endophytica TaxID=2558362 RepID=A0A4Y8RG68_9HYPH|nr:phage tail assembly protein [Jiella endophytica]TFF20828.1 phage tail assembly protein [Jiella endophytica]